LAGGDRAAWLRASRGFILSLRGNQARKRRAFLEQACVILFVSDGA
jgi:hypothetical protein